MKVEELHTWDVSTDRAKEIQNELRGRIVRKGGPDRLRYIAGADCSFRRSSDVIYSAVVLYDLEENEVIETQTHAGPLEFPYVPGLLSFREMPGLLPCFRSLSKAPDAVIADGHGYAHPRRFGLACHLGLFLDTPTVGCAKSKLIGEHEEPDEERGSFSRLRVGKEIIGSVLRTRTRVNPVYVSSGHRISLPESRDVILKSGRGYKLPEPQRRADLEVARTKKQHA